MKKAKIISIIVIMLSVIALGVFMGKQMFKLMEAGSDQPAPVVANAETEAQSTVKVLYNINNNDSASPAQVNAEKPAGLPSQPNSAIKAEAVPTTTGSSAVETATKEPKFEPNGPKWYAYASGNGTNARTGPATSDKLFFKVGKGTRGVVLEKKNGWTHIKWDFNRKSGWVRDDLLIQGPASIMINLVQKADDSGKIDTSEVAKLAAKEALRENLVSVAIAKPALASETVSTYTQGQALPESATIEAQTFANVRSQPNTTSEKLGKLPKGMVVKIKSTQKEGRWRWFEIIYNDGRKTGWTREDNLKF